MPCSLIHTTKPDVIGTESWLKPKHFDNEIFSPDQGYTPSRRDRVGQNGGGVFIAVRNDIVVQEMKDIEYDCEDVWIKIDLFGSKSLIIGAYYKPHEHDQQCWEEFSKSLSKTRKLNCNIWVAGDFNLLKMDWDHMCHSPVCKHPHSTDKSLKYQMTQIVLKLSPY